MPVPSGRGPSSSTARAELHREATQFYELDEVRAVIAAGRLPQILDEIDATGTYEQTAEQTAEELLLEAKLAWRNHARCSGRYSWRSLSLVDARAATTADEVAQRCFEHLKISTNEGRLRPVLTVFRQRRGGARGIRIINPQRIR